MKTHQVLGNRQPRALLGAWFAFQIHLTPRYHAQLVAVQSIDCPYPSHQVEPTLAHKLSNEKRTMRKVAIVTGGTRGIGSGIADALGEAGFDLLLTYNSNKEAADAFVATLQSKYNNIHCELVGGDVSQSSTRDAIFACFDTKFPKDTSTLRATIHNAGQYIGVTSTNTDDLSPTRVTFGENSLLDDATGKPDFDHMHYYQALYGDAYIDLCERSLARMSAETGGGSLIGISSPGCNFTYKVNAGYSLPGSGKCVMEYANRIIAVSAGPKNVNCNVIVPGVTLSDAWGKIAAMRGASADDITNMIVKSSVPMARPLDVRGIGDVAAFLCGEKGRYITGVSLPVDGGLHLK